MNDLEILPNKKTNKGTIAFIMATIDAIIVVLAIFMIIRFIQKYLYFNK